MLPKRRVPLWDYKIGRNSSYENLFKLCAGLGLPHADTAELYRRMVFNVAFMNTDDHLKNTSFVYDDAKGWRLAPAYDLTYALDPLLDFSRANRALSVRGKRNGITRDDLLSVARDFGVGNAAATIDRTVSEKDALLGLLEASDVPERVARAIDRRLSANISEVMGIRNGKGRGHPV